MATAREMANWIFFWDDAASDGVTTIPDHSTETAGYLAESLLDTDRQTVFMTSDTGTIYAEFNLGSTQTIYGVGIHNHNANTKGAANFSVKYGTDGAAWSTDIAFDVPTYCGDDDFFTVVNGGTGRSCSWIRVEFASIDAASFYIGRVYLARAMYELPNGPGVGATKGYAKDENVIMTPGGIEHRSSQSLRRRIINAVIPNASTTVRAQIKALVESCDVGHKCFFMSDPFGTTTYTTTNRVGAAIHARLNTNEWVHPMLITSLTDIPLSIIEVL